MLLSKTKTDVIIDESITEIKTHSSFLRLYHEKDEILADIPLYQVRSIMIMGTKINIPARLVKLCSNHKIPLHILTNRNKHIGTLNFGCDTNILNRQTQYKASLESKWQVYLAKQILNQKLQTQKILTQYWGYSFYSKKISTLQSSINHFKTTLGLLGCEGSAASNYWKVFGKEIVKSKLSIKWPGRIKNPTKDPINSLLSLGYGLLATQCQSSLSLIGFDPFLGLLHKTNSDRPALTYDIMEVYRVLLVDIWVMQLFKDKYFVKKDFVNTCEGVCTLEPSKKNEFFRLWFKRLKYYSFESNFGEVTINEFIDHNTVLLLKWFEEINSNKERDTGRVNRFPEHMIVFSDINQFKKY